MSTLFENKDRKVIPNFRNLKKTLDLGELNPNKITTDPFEKDDLASYYKDFLDDKSVGTAGDLISAAIVNNIFNDPIIIEAANFLLKNHSHASQLQITVAKKILNINGKNEKSNINTLDDFLELRSRPIINDRIRRIKNDKSYFLGNPFLYVELARLYSIIGQKELAIKNIKIAKSLSQYNRYVLRSYSRLMAHFGDLDAAHENLKRSSATKHDPWLMASEIAFASLRDKSSNFLKIGNTLLTSKEFDSFSISELASSIGTVELINGNRKKSKSLLQSALLSPNDNALAQIEWINNKEDFFDLDVAKLNVDNKYEALTLENYNSKNWKETIKHAENWFIDMPFAKRPIMFGHHAASFFLEDHELAIKFCKAGLVANPNDAQIINNIAFSYAMNNDAQIAFEYLAKVNISSVKEDHIRICLLATSGLAHYRSGNPLIGREFYLKAIKEANEKKNDYYSKLALMNLAREEMRISSPVAKSLYDQVINVDIANNRDLEFLKNKIKLYFEEGGKA